MGCSGCGTPAGCNNNGTCGTSGCNKLSVFDWLANMRLPDGQKPFDIVEIRFKNSRKEFYKNVNNLSINVGDPVVVEANSGYDVGTVSLTGELVKLQLKKRNINADSDEIRRILRPARQLELDKWKEARDLEVSTMYKARTIALRLGLEMKLSDVEYQGDKSKATFYYTADARVDFRELIKVLAEEFRIRVEMRQIGNRLEASRLGGIGSCGRELCCSTWLTDYRVVNSSAARYQQLALTASKLSGQCGKLKCCLNYELDSYVDTLKEFPDMDGKKLQTKKGEAFLQKTDVFRRMMWFSYRGESSVFIPMRIEDVKVVLEANAKGEFPEELKAAPRVNLKQVEVEPEPIFENVVGQDSLTRFDQKKGDRNRSGKGKFNQNQQRGGKTLQKSGQKQNPPQASNPTNNPTAKSSPSNNGPFKPRNNRNDQPTKSTGGSNRQNTPTEKKQHPPQQNKPNPQKQNNPKEGGAEGQAQKKHRHPQRPIKPRGGENPNTPNHDSKV